MAGMSEREWATFAATRNLDPATGKERKLQIEDVEHAVSDMLVETNYHLTRELKKLRDKIERLMTMTAIGFVILTALVLLWR